MTENRSSKFIRRLKRQIRTLLFNKPKLLKYKFLSTCQNIHGKAKCIQAVQFNGKGEIRFGLNVQIGFDPSPFLYSGYGYIEARNAESLISIADNVIINNNVVIISESEGISIGPKTLIGSNCEITDSDFHHLDPLKRHTEKANVKKVVIEENVFIGSNVKILKGVTIGKNSVIANGAIVSNSIPENVIVAGIPAKIIKTLDEIH